MLARRGATPKTILEGARLVASQRAAARGESNDVAEAEGTIVAALLNYHQALEAQAEPPNPVAEAPPAGDPPKPPPTEGVDKPDEPDHPLPGVSRPLSQPALRAG